MSDNHTQNTDRLRRQTPTEVERRRGRAPPEVTIS